MNLIIFVMYVFLSSMVLVGYVVEAETNGNVPSARITIAVIGLALGWFDFFTGNISKFILAVWHSIAVIKD